MSSQGWRKNSSITRKLTETPYEYSFLQSIRLLERSALLEKVATQSSIASNPLARFTPPDSEALRLLTHQSLAFPSSEVKSIQREVKKNGKSQWQMKVNIMGLTGAMGVLPYHYTELLLKRQKLKDDTLEHFFNLFNHRTLSLFFEASTKYHLPLQYERNKLHAERNRQNSRHTQALLSLIGFGTQGLNNRLHTKDESLLFYSGLLSQKIRTATGLKQMLRAHFQIPVDIQQFVGQWQELIDDVRTRLPDFNHPSGCNASLGKTAMLGKKGWFAQGKIRIILGPLDSKQLKRFAPGTSALKALNELVRLYLGMEHDYEFIIRIRTKDIPDRIQLQSSSAPIIGWNTWLSKKSEQESGQATRDIKVSASRLK